MLPRPEGAPAGTPRDAVMTGLQSRSAHWFSAAVAWLEQGFPIDDEIAAVIVAVRSDRRLPQRARQSAWTLWLAWRRSQPGAAAAQVPLRTAGLTSIDDFVADHVGVDIVRTGVARYRWTLVGAQRVEFNLWTSKKGKVYADSQPAPPEWVRVAVASDGALDALYAEDCGVHIERMDRGVWWAGLSRLDEHWAITFHTPGYIRVALRPGSGLRPDTDE